MDFDSIRTHTVAEHTIKRLIAQLYDAGVDAGQWPAVLAAIGIAVRATSAGLGYVGPVTRGTLATWGFSAERERAYNTYYSSINPFSSAVLSLLKSSRLESAYLSEQLVSASALRKTEFYVDYIRRYGTFHHCVTFNIEGRTDADATLLAVSGFRPESSKPFDADDCALFAILRPHVSRALEMARRLNGLNDLRRASREALDSLRSAVFLVNRDGQVLFANTTAIRMLEKGETVRLGRSFVLSTRPDEPGRTLREAIAEAAGTTRGHGTSAGRAFQIRRDGKSALSVTVTPTPSIRLAAGYAESVVIVNDPELQIPSHEQALSQLFRLTSTEAAVVARLAAGRTVLEIAHWLGATVLTVRTHLQRAYRKVGVSNQAQLVGAVVSRLHAESLYTGL